MQHGLGSAGIELENHARIVGASVIGRAEEISGGIAIHRRRRPFSVREVLKRMHDGISLRVSGAHKCQGAGEQNEQAFANTPARGTFGFRHGCHSFIYSLDIS